MNMEEFGLDEAKPLVMSDEAGVIVDINDEFPKLFLWNRDELIGEPLLKIIPPNLHDAHNLGFSRFISTEEPTLLDKPLKLAAVNKNGEQFVAMHLIRAKKHDGRWFFAANIYITEE